MPMKRVKTCQPALHHSVAGSATKMARSKSSSHATPPNPFTAGRGSVRPVPGTQGLVSTARFPTQATPQHPPPNSDIFASIPMNNYMGGPDQLYGNVLDPVMEHSPMMGTFQTPAAYLQRVDVGMNTPRSQVIVPAYEQHHMHESSQPYSSHDVPASQCGSLSSGLTISDTSMTRSNSHANQSVPGLGMMGYSSQSSFGDDLSNADFGYNSDLRPSPSNKRSAPGQSMLDLASSPPTGSFANYSPVPMDRSASIDSRLSSGHPQHMPHASVGMQHRHMSIQSQSMQQSGSQQSFTDTAQAGATQSGQLLERTVSASSSQSHQLKVEQSEPMVRTDSARSAKSTQSQRERGKEALKRHNKYAAIQSLAPKPKNESSSPASAQSDLKAGADGSKLPVQKASGYVRPKRAKINCDQCDEHPDGFRGEHELRRHRDLKHSKEYKRFVCRTPAQLGLTSDLQPITPLEKCKHCEANKEYGQYYNAAAHLRRAHFKEKPPRASRSKNASGKEEPRPKRAGMGGGDWPPMAELKAKWMEEIKSTKPPQDAATVSDDEAHQDMEMIDGPMSLYMDARFDDISFVGTNTDLQVQNNDVYTDAFNSDPNSNYTTSPLVADYDPNMASIPSNGSANFDFNSPINHPHPYFPHDLSIDLSLSSQHFQSPNTSASTATLTPFNSFAQHDSQFAQQQKSGQPMMGQSPQQDMLVDMDFGLAMGAEFDDPSLHQS